MLLAIDIGNTNVVCGLFEGSTLRGHWRVRWIFLHRVANEVYQLFHFTFVLGKCLFVRRTNQLYIPLVTSLTLLLEDSFTADLGAT